MNVSSGCAKNPPTQPMSVLDRPLSPPRPPWPRSRSARTAPPNPLRRNVRSKTCSSPVRYPRRNPARRRRGGVVSPKRSPPAASFNNLALSLASGALTCAKPPSTPSTLASTSSQYSIPLAYHSGFPSGVLAPRFTFAQNSSCVPTSRPRSSQPRKLGAGCISRVVSALSSPAFVSG